MPGPNLEWKETAGLHVAEVGLPDGDIVEINLMSRADGDWSVFARSASRDFVSRLTSFKAPGLEAAKAHAPFAAADAAREAGAKAFAASAAFAAAVEPDGIPALGPDERKGIAFALMRPCTPAGVPEANDAEIHEWIRRMIAEAAETWRREISKRPERKGKKP